LAKSPARFPETPSFFLSTCTTKTAIIPAKKRQDAKSKDYRFAEDFLKLGRAVSGEQQ